MSSLEVVSGKIYQSITNLTDCLNRATSDLDRKKCRQILGSVLGDLEKLPRNIREHIIVMLNPMSIRMLCSASTEYRKMCTTDNHFTNLPAIDGYKLARNIGNGQLLIYYLPGAYLQALKDADTQMLMLIYKDFNTLNLLKSEYTDKTAIQWGKKYNLDEKNLIPQVNWNKVGIKPLPLDWDIRNIRISSSYELFKNHTVGYIVKNKDKRLLTLFSEAFAEDIVWDEWLYGEYYSLMIYMALIFGNTDMAIKYIEEMRDINKEESYVDLLSDPIEYGADSVETIESLIPVIRRNRSIVREEEEEGDIDDPWWDNMTLKKNRKTTPPKKTIGDIFDEAGMKSHRLRN